MAAAVAADWYRLFESVLAKHQSLKVRLYEVAYATFADNTSFNKAKLILVLGLRSNSSYGANFWLSQVIAGRGALVIKNSLRLPKQGPGTCAL